MKEGIDTGLALRMIWPALILSLVAVGLAGPLRLLFSCVSASLRLCVKILGSRSKHHIFSTAFGCGSAALGLCGFLAHRLIARATSRFGAIALVSCIALLPCDSLHAAVIVTASNTVGLIATTDSTGVYTITSRSPNWTFAGNLGTPAESLALKAGTDNIGGYSEISFFYTNSVGHSGGIRIYSNQPVVLFSESCLAPSTNNFAFPRFTTYPTNLFHIAFNGSFGIYTFNTLAGDSPWLFFNTNFDSFLLSAAANFMLAKNSQAVSNGQISCGLDPAITNLPSNFTHRTILVLQNGVNRTFETWGTALTALSGKIRPANDAAVELNKLGYWTDNGATYYYNYDTNKGYEGTLLAVRDEFASKGIPLGYPQLDSWWYPKSYLATWQGTPTNNRGGIFLYQADTQLFPDSLAGFHNQLGLPLVTHARWIDDSSPYRTNYAISRNAPVDLNYWTNIMASIVSAGVATYEQDWLDGYCLPLMNLNDPPAFMNYMAAAAVSNGINLQYCLPLPRHYLQGSLYNNLLTMRVSGDHFTSGNWNSFLFDSRLVSALGAWPWCDVFMSSEPRSVLLATLSAGPVGPGDALGAVNAANLLKAVRPDSVIVKPDVPLLPLDPTCLNDAQGKALPMLAATFTDHNGFKAVYVFSYARQATNTAASFVPASLGIPGDAYVYDYFNQTGTIVPSGNLFAFTTTLPDVNTGGSYFIAVPIGPSGLALLGDTNKYVSLGKKRISDLSDSGVLSATIQFSTSETNLTLSGYAPAMPFVSASIGTVHSVNYDAAKHWFTAIVAPGPSQSATATLSLRPILQADLQPGRLLLSWPSTPATVLEKATTLSSPADWAPATNAITTLGSRNIATADTAPGAAFFRLKQ